MKRKWSGIDTQTTRPRTRLWTRYLSNISRLSSDILDIISDFLTIRDFISFRRLTNKRLFLPITHYKDKVYLLTRAAQYGQVKPFEYELLPYFIPILQDTRPNTRRAFIIESVNESFVLACRYGHLDFIQSCMHHLYAFINPSWRYNAAIRLACRFHHMDIVKYLISLNVDPSDFANEAFRSAVKYNYTDLVMLLLQDDRIDPGDMHNMALYHAVTHKNKPLVELLLHHPRVDPSDMNHLALQRACQNNDVEMAQLIYSHYEKRPLLPRPSYFVLLEIMHTALLSHHTRLLVWLAHIEPRLKSMIPATELE